MKIEKVNNTLRDASDGVLETLKQIKDINYIDDETTEEILKRLEIRVFLLRELVDFRMSKVE